MKSLIKIFFHIYEKQERSGHLKVDHIALPPCCVFAGPKNLQHPCSEHMGHCILRYHMYFGLGDAGAYKSIYRCHSTFPVEFALKHF